jgi:hypothetical protein
LGTLRRAFTALSVLSPVIVAMYVVVRTHGRVSKAVTYGEHEWHRREYTVKSYVVSTCPTMFTIFVLLILIVLRVLISSINDVIVDRVYFSYSGNYSCTIRMTPSGSDVLSDAMKNVGALRHSNDSFEFDTRSDDDVGHIVPMTDDIAVSMAVSISLLVLGLIAKVAANLEDSLLHAISESTKVRIGAVHVDV